MKQGVNSVFLATVNMHKNFRRSRIFLSDDDLVIIKTAIIQLSSGIERIKSRKNIIEINEKLNSLAITDMLTGLYNRQGFGRKHFQSGSGTGRRFRPYPRQPEQRQQRYRRKKLRA